MNEDALLRWFERKRESNIVSKTREHVGKVVDTTYELNCAMTCAIERKKEEAEKCLQRLFMNEKDADNLETIISEELSKGDLPSKEREDLMHLIRRSDYVADWTKESGKNLEILLESQIEVPVVIWEMYREMSTHLFQCAKALKLAIDSFGGPEAEVLKHEREIQVIEHEMDELYFKTKRKMLSSSLDHRAMIMLRDVLHAMENAADNCKDAADIVHMLVISHR